MQMRSTALICEQFQGDTAIEQLGQMASETFCPMSCWANNSNYSGYFNQGCLDRVTLSDVGGSALEVDRRKQHISQVADSYYLVKFQLHGMSKLQHMGRESILHPGDFILCNSSEPYRLSFKDNYRQTVMAIPQAQLNTLVSDVEDSVGYTMSGDSPVNGMLSQFVSSLMENYNTIPPDSFRRLEANALDLLVTSLEASKALGSKEKRSVKDDHFMRIKQFIFLHLSDSRLSPDFIADIEGISTRYLHMLFKSEGVSISRYIQYLRLEACAKKLSDPQYNRASVLEIALDQGFNDVSSFYRSFRNHFGITPKQYRVKTLNS
ncbi:helix-turn-helix domain-containing protein [Dasania marina]|uniref:helix-turn-helix domain-containing protein n=1 Tax=Dasania marina TaxID=471499 RepID=UPI0030DAEF7F|tara:strand:- start:51427 stop:52389 length:963 start_codon:yes stop_codon:yes gene_type:complete